MTTPDTCPHRTRAKRIRETASAIADAAWNLILPATLAIGVLVIFIAALLDAIRG